MPDINFIMFKSAQSRIFAILVVVFFFWGFVAASNDILIPIFKKKSNLEQWQSQLISFAFYIAYTIGSLIYIFVSSRLKQDLIQKIGYGKAIGVGLLVSAVGTLFFIPATGQDFVNDPNAGAVSFGLVLTGLIIVGLGFSLQQTVANPLAIGLGSKDSGSQRLSLAGGINNFGTTIGPLLVSRAVFGELGSSLADDAGALDITQLKVPYLILGAIFVLFAVIFWRLRIHLSEEDADVTNDGATVSADKSSTSILSYPQLWMGMIAIFLYVGVEVSTAGNLSEYLEKNMGISTRNAAPFVSLFWASLMIGRWTGAAGSFGLKGIGKAVLRVVLPFAAFGVYWLVNSQMGADLSQFVGYLGMVVVIVLADFISKGNPVKQLFIYSSLGIAALLVGIFSGGFLAAMAFVSVGLFCSTLWPCIFTIAITGLGNLQSKGSNFLIMMIMGGGFVSVFQGYLSGKIGILNSYWVGVVCFVYLAYYAWRMKSYFKQQGISLGPVEGGH